MHVKQTTITGKSGIGVGAVYFIRDAILLACRRLDGVKTNVNQRRRNSAYKLSLSNWKQNKNTNSVSN